MCVCPQKTARHQREGELKGSVQRVNWINGCNGKYKMETARGVFPLFHISQPPLLLCSYSPPRAPSLPGNLLRDLCILISPLLVGELAGNLIHLYKHTTSITSLLQNGNDREIERERESKVTRVGFLRKGYQDYSQRVQLFKSGMNWSSRTKNFLYQFIRGPSIFFFANSHSLPPSYSPQLRCHRWLKGQSTSREGEIGVLTKANIEISLSRRFIMCLCNTYVEMRVVYDDSSAACVLIILKMCLKAWCTVPLGALLSRGFNDEIGNICRNL